MRQCGTPESRCAMGAWTAEVAAIIRADQAIEAGLITMRDLDYWTLTGVEHLRRERSRYQRHYREQKQPDMRRRPGEID